MAITVLSHDSLLRTALVEILTQAGLDARPSSADEMLEEGAWLRDEHHQRPDVRLGTGGLPFPIALTALLYALQQPALPEEIALSAHTCLLPAARLLRGAGGEEAVTEKEIALLLALKNAPLHCMTRADVLAAVWGYDAEKITTNTLETHLYRLRKKMRDAGCDQTVHVVDGNVVMMAA